jgi:3-isopropylmalate dehydrogenase
VSGDVARAAGVEWRPINIDYAAYQLVRDPGCFDVILTPNLFGDILIDLAGVLQVSRGVTCSGNFDAEGHGVYQTNHGCAHDLAGTDTANPAGQILALAMLLRENFGLAEEAWQIESALAQTWAGGWRTADLAAPGSQVLGTRAMSEKVAERLVEAVAVAASLP